MRRILAFLFSLTFLALPVQAAEDTKYVALTFDDGPSGKYTRQLLDGLYDRGVQATFLLCGYRMKEYPDIAQRIFEEGHEIGYHGYSDAVRQVAEARNLAILNWSVDPKDWATHDTAAIERAVLKNVKDGDIVLLHDMTISSVRAALDIVDVLLEEDFEIVTVSELARLRNVKLKPGQVYSSFPKETDAVK